MDSFFGKQKQQLQSYYYNGEPPSIDNNNNNDYLMTIQPELLRSSSSTAVSVFGNESAEDDDVTMSQPSSTTPTPTPPPPLASGITGFLQSAHQRQTQTSQQKQEEQVVVVRPERIDRLLAQELNQMTFQQREHIHEEIHGVHTFAVDETPQFVYQKLESLQHAIDEIPHQHKVAYEEAIRLNSQYVQDAENFRLPFLRAELFDTTKAAFRLVRFLNFMYDLYGQDALMRPMTLNDLSPVDMKLMKEGYFQALPGRDRSGRRIWGIFDDIPSEYSFRTRIKVSNYIIMSLAEDVETQRKGMVLLIYQPPNAKVCMDHQERENVSILFEAVPQRISAVHICIPDNPISQMIKAVMLLAIGQDRRARTRFHAGSATECQYALQSFGIPAQQLPINTNSGRKKIKYHLKWIELRQMKETATSPGANFDGVECPELKDILFGRGRPTMRHPGNVVLRTLLESRLQEYNLSESKKDKTDIAWSIVRQIKDCSCRFLKEDSNGYWIEVSDEVARQKVSVGFRDLRKTADKNDHPDEIGSNKASSAATATTTTHAAEVPSAPIIKRKSGSEEVHSGKSSIFLGLDGRYKKQRCGLFDCDESSPI